MNYALEARRRIKEQMNKRKPDDEFANINLSFFNAKGEEIVVHCPESKEAFATLHPTRKEMHSKIDNDVATGIQNEDISNQDESVNKYGNRMFQSTK